MKRFLSLAFICISSLAVYAEGFDNFAFTLGTCYADDKVAAAHYSGTMVGLDYSFPGNFVGGVKFFSLPTDFMAVNVSYRTSQDITFSVYTGADTTSGTLFGLGLGYDFFVNNSSTFTSLGLYMDWMAGDAASAYDLTSGGVFLIGLRAGMGK